jgi:hypothetical protein
MTPEPPIAALIHTQCAEAVAEAQQWRPIKWAPVDEEVLLFIPGYLDEITIGIVGECRDTCITHDDCEFENNGDDHFPTHWMSLPAPPKQGGRGMKTTLNQIKQFNPCESGWEKLIVHLGPDFPADREFPVSEVVKSNGVADTFWLLKGIMELGALKKLSVEFSCDCAERVLPIFEAGYPDNPVPRKAIEAAREWLKNPTEENARASTSTYAASASTYAASASAASAAASASAASAAASAASAAAASAYARAAASAAASAASAAAASAYARAAAAAAADTAALASARAAADDASAAASAARDATRAKQRQWQQNRLIELLEG